MITAECVIGRVPTANLMDGTHHATDRYVSIHLNQIVSELQRIKVSGGEKGERKEKTDR